MMMGGAIRDEDGPRCVCLFLMSSSFYWTLFLMSSRFVDPFIFLFHRFIVSFRSICSLVWLCHIHSLRFVSFTHSVRPIRSIVRSFACLAVLC
ncbi:hypothetical protein DFH05DRAFT_1498991 [Lentinula detonsa]|uniref:Uncharacterized protein n=1 Tax=Lentinula detonsa TaxID=2804962 RepID=A0A9W8NXY2_9AGAR|nr:hypothetical protein DFH05DRAFT_1498991 [Lentinula detonsa]